MPSGPLAPGDNLDIGRPEAMQLVFCRRVRTPPVGGYRTEGPSPGVRRLRVMALSGALCAVVHTITGFTNRSRRTQMAIAGYVFQTRMAA